MVRITRSAATLESSSYLTEPTCKPASSKVFRAASWVCPETSGTVISAAPEDSWIVTVEPGSTIDPGLGSVAATLPLSTVSEAIACPCSITKPRSSKLRCASIALIPIMFSGMATCSGSWFLLEAISHQTTAMRAIATNIPMTTAQIVFLFFFFWAISFSSSSSSRSSPRTCDHWAGA